MRYHNDWHNEQLLLVWLGEREAPADMMAIPPASSEATEQRGAWLCYYTRGMSRRPMLSRTATREELIAAYRLAAIPAKERVNIYLKWWPRFNTQSPRTQSLKDDHRVVLALPLPAGADATRLALVRRMVARGCQSAVWLARETGMTEWMAERYLRLAQQIEQRSKVAA